MSGKMGKFPKAFRGLLEYFDRFANSQITENNKEVKILADWGRTACDRIDKLEEALEQIIIESGDLIATHWPKPQQKCQSIARIALKDSE